MEHGDLDYDGTTLDQRTAGIDLDVGGDTPPSSVGGEPAAPPEFDPALLAPLVGMFASIPFDLLATFYRDDAIKLDEKQETEWRKVLTSAVAYSVARQDWGRYVMNPWGAVAFTAVPLVAGKLLQHKARVASENRRVASMASNGATAAAGGESSSSASPEQGNLPNSGEEQDYVGE